jgi:glycosyltransferase involved in cell wall biosynthesis
MNTTATNPAVEVSVIIPLYNRAHLIGAAINSVLAQGLQGIEIIVIDDGSSDDIASALAPFSGQVTLLHKGNGGVSSARNTGLAAARGNYIAYLDSDDIWAATKLRKYLQIFAQYSDVGFVFSNFSRFSVIDDGVEYPQTNAEFFPQIEHYRGASIETPFPACHLDSASMFTCLLAGFFLGPSTLMMRRNLQAMVGDWSESYRISEDLHYLLRLATKSNAVYVDEVLTSNGRGDDNLSREPLDSSKADIHVLKELRNDLRFSSMQRQQIDKHLSRRCMQLGYQLKQHEDYKAAQRAYVAASKYHPGNTRALANILLTGFRRISR